MLILLPPSERKTPAAQGSGAPLDPAALHHPSLTAQRLAVLESLAAVSAAEDALTVLGAGTSLAGEVERNTRWRTEPAQRVGSLYTGVLYDALDLGSLRGAARARAVEAVRVVSAAHGLLRLDDAVPAYRLSMGTVLPGVGALAPAWRPLLAELLDPEVAAGRLVVDARSSAYAAAWQPPRAHAGQVVAVRVLVERDGRRSVVSHMAKHTRGLLAGHLLRRRRAQPGTPEQLARAAGELFHVELAPPRTGAVRRLDVIIAP